MSQYDFALDTPQMLAEKRKQERNSRKALPAASSDVLEGNVSSPVTGDGQVLKCWGIFKTFIQNWLAKKRLFQDFL